ncbi:MAG TPA: gliding motility protein, partial [Polyangiales bacterium]|nr:gliding motility protein [Polyangiales bacterium]
ADGVAFIADSQRSETKSNSHSFVNLRQNLSDNGLDPASMPLVIQFNKRDLADIRPDAELDQLAKQGKEPVFKAVAMKGTGVIETFLGLLTLTWNKLEQTNQLKQKFQISGDEVIEHFRGQLKVPEGLDVSTGGAKR